MSIARHLCQRKYNLQTMNLLTKTEQFDDAAWDVASPARVTITANSTTDPIGGSTADTMTEAATTSTHRVVQVVTMPASIAAVTYTITAYYKVAAGSPLAALAMTDNSGNNQVRAWFNLSAGTVGTTENVGNSSGATATITSVGSGWYKCKLTGSASSSPPSSPTLLTAFVGMAETDGVLSYTGSTGRAVYLWGADLRLASDATTYPLYQRIG